MSLAPSVLKKETFPALRLTENLRDIQEGIKLQKEHDLGTPRDGEVGTN